MVIVDGHRAYALLFTMKRPDYEAGMTHARVYSPTLIPKKDNRNSKHELKQPKTPNPAPGTAI